MISRSESLAAGSRILVPPETCTPRPLEPVNMEAYMAKVFAIVIEMGMSWGDFPGLIEHP